MQAYEKCSNYFGFRRIDILELYKKPSRFFGSFLISAFSDFKDMISAFTP
jgi:hypothetical protein